LKNNSTFNSTEAMADICACSVYIFVIFLHLRWGPPFSVNLNWCV